MTLSAGNPPRALRDSRRDRRGRHGRGLSRAGPAAGAGRCGQGPTGSLATDPRALARFEREAKAVAALSHPNILAIHDFETQSGVCYAVTELLEGATLRELLEGGTLTARRAIEYALQIAQGLAAAHERGVVHRDLKPENVFVTKSGHVKILDFGLAKSTTPEELKSATKAPTVAESTEPGTLLGTVGYMSPEQVRGLPRRRPDGRGFEAKIPKPLFVAPVRAFSGLSRRQYDVSADGQRFILNAALEEKASVPITLVQNWTAKAPR